MLMASLRDPYAAAAAAGVGMLAASQLAQLNQLMMQQQQQHAHQLQMQQQQHQQPHSPSQAGGPLQLGGPPLGPPLGSPPECQSPPISRTYTYKKVTKPLLERKRRARINRCLDELKELMVGALEAEGENVSKLEKADILELTVRHLQRITKPRDVAEDASRFQAGFSQCASEACHFLLGLPGLDAAVGRRLVAHLGQVVNQVGLGALGPAAAPGMAPRPASTASTTTTYSPPASPDQHPGHPDADVLRQLARQQQLQQLQQGAADGPAHLRAALPFSSSGDADGEVSSSTSRGGTKRAGSGQGRSDLDDDSEDDDDDDHDSDAPVNYSSEALHRQHGKRPRFDYPVGSSASAGSVAGARPGSGPGAEGTAGACAKEWVSSSKESQGSQSGSDDDEDKGPMWRPW